MEKSRNRAAQIRERLARTVELLCSHTPRGEVAETLCKQFGISPATAWRAIAKVRREILPTWYEWSEQRVLVAEHLARLDRIIKKAVEEGQLHAAIRAIRQQCELQGLNSARQIADSRDTLRGQIEEMRARRHGGDQSDRPAGGSAPLEQINAIRATYGMRPMTQEEYDEAAGNGVN